MADEVQIKTLLEMKVDDFASPQEKREQELAKQKLAKESTRVDSNFESIVESRRRAAQTAGEEVWRTGMSGTATVAGSATSAAAQSQAQTGGSSVERRGDSSMYGASDVETISLDTSLFTSFNKESSESTGDGTGVKEEELPNKNIYKYGSMDPSDVHKSLLTTPVRLLCSTNIVSGGEGGDSSRVTLELVHYPKEPVKKTAAGGANSGGPVRKYLVSV